MGEIIDPTLVIWALPGGADLERVEPGLSRVRDHYGEIAHEPLQRESWLGERAGMAAFHDPALRCAWPQWSAADGVAMSGGYVPIGWERIVGIADPAEAAPALARELLENPRRAALELNSPAVLAIADTQDERIVIVNDRLGAGRLYELEYEGGTVWSNRLGALPLFAGTPVRADPRGWALFAANGWFMRDSTPIEGAVKVPPSSVIELTRDGIRREQNPATAKVIDASDDDMAALIERFAAEARETVSAANAIYPEPPMIDLSGGRDSRVSAAAAIAAKIPARFRTSDVNPGEADIAVQLVAAAPREMNHKVTYTGNRVKERKEDLRDRALNAYLLHDGMRYAGKVRGRLQLPPPPQQRAAISGHGGEIGHGFYYDAKKLERIEQKGEEGMIERLVTSCRRTHSAGHEHVYEAARAEFEAAIADGKAAGIEGPALLDYYYLMDRFAHRSGHAAHTQRVTVFSTPAFLEAAFSLTPRERLDAIIHKRVTALLVPEWADIPYHQATRGRQAKIRRKRIWEASDGRTMKRLLKDEDCWHEIFQPKVVRKLWRRARLGRGRGEWEHVFERITCRVAFEDYSKILNRKTGA